MPSPPRPGGAPLTPDQAASARRRAQTDCQFEPSYGLEGEVIFAIRAPHLTAHWPHPECPEEGPHEIAHCPLWQVEALPDA